LAVALAMTGLTLLAETQGAGAAVLNYSGTGVSEPNGLTVGPDGALWFTNGGNDSIGRITTGGTVTNFTGPGVIVSPGSITTGPDGALWFVNGNNRIGRITTGGVVTTYPGVGISSPSDITAGPDGALWFTNFSNNSIGRIATGGTVSNFTGAGISGPDGITTGPDGALWFANETGDSIGRITTGGTVSTYTGPGLARPAGIISGPDGALWFVNGDVEDSSVGRITTGGTVTNYTDPSISGPTDIVSGPDGALWFTNYGSIGRVTVGGTVSSFTDPSIGNTFGVASGPDGAVWFTNYDNDSIGQIVAVPGAPAIRSVRSGIGSITVSFAPGVRGLPSLTSYRALCTPIGPGASGSRSGTHNPLIVSGLTNGRDYRCTVRATNLAGNSAESMPSGVVTPSPTFVTVSCAATSSCAASVPSPPSLSAPGQAVQISGVPSEGVGSIKVSNALGTLGCPAVGPKQHRITTLTDKGFSPQVRLHVAVTLHIASATSPEGVCFNSEVPFRSQRSPKVKKAGTGMLLACSRVANVAPCVTSSRQVGANIVVKFDVPGGDPRFFVSLPRGRQTWLAGAGIAKVGKRYSVHLEAFGGTAPFHWKVTSGKLPPGLSLNTGSGLVSGTPTRKGKFTFAVQATDSGRPAQTATLNIPIVVK
jgi:virginiamycin B lyase